VGFEPRTGRSWLIVSGVMVATTFGVFATTLGAFATTLGVLF
jgi:hypothetical protein